MAHTVSDSATSVHSGRRTRHTHANASVQTTATVGASRLARCHSCNAAGAHHCEQAFLATGVVALRTAWMDTVSNTFSIVGEERRKVRRPREDWRQQEVATR